MYNKLIILVNMYIVEIKIIDVCERIFNCLKFFINNVMIIFVCYFYDCLFCYMLYIDYIRENFVIIVRGKGWILDFNCF